MPASEEQTEYISDLFEQCVCDENDVADMLDEFTGFKGFGRWPQDADRITWWEASGLIDALKDLKRDQERLSGRRESR